MSIIGNSSFFESHNIGVTFQLFISLWGISENKKYLSVDINSANWQVIKKYDPDFLNELGSSWSELLKNISSSHYGNDQDFLSHHIYPIIRKSCLVHASHNKIEGSECKDFVYKEGDKFIGAYVYV